MQRQIEEQKQELVSSESEWEEFDITGEISELADGMARSSPRPNEPQNLIVGSQPKEGVRLSVSRSIFHTAKRTKGKATRFRGD